MIAATASGTSLNAGLDYLVDATGLMTIDDVRQSSQFAPTHGKTGSGYVGHPVWLRLTIQRSDDAPGRWWLEITPSVTPEIAMYRPDAQGEYGVSRSGDRYPFSQRPFPYRQYLYSVDLEPNKPTVLYFRLYTETNACFPVRIWQLDDWASRTNLEYLLYGLCFGVMLGLALYNLLLFFWLRDSIFMLYSLTMVCYCLYAAEMGGLASQVLWSQAIQTIIGRPLITVSLFAGVATLFALRLLDSPMSNKWWRYSMRGLALMFFTSLFAVVLGYPSTSAVVLYLSSWIAPPLVLSFAIYRACSGYAPATFYVLGYGPVLLAITILACVIDGVLPANHWNQSILIFAGAWEAIMFSQALAVRVNILKRERMDAMRMAYEEKTVRLEDARNHQRELEQKVEDRTSALSAEALRHKETAEALGASQAQLLEMAYCDVLTGLPNRRLFVDRVEEAIAASQRHGKPFALLVLDLDQFKQVNDNHGHDTGDALLVTVGQRLQNATRPHDVVARLGGDEFALLIAPPLDEKTLSAICQRLLSALNGTVDLDGKEVAIGISAGVAWFGLHGEEFSQLYKAADQALYRAKQAGRGTARVFEVPDATPPGTA